MNRSTITFPTILFFYISICMYLRIGLFIQLIYGNTRYIVYYIGLCYQLIYGN